MPQRLFGPGGASTTSVALPPPHAHVAPGVPWGRHDVLFTPAYWKAQCWLADVGGGTPPSADYRLGRTLAEEVAACLLGGHGIPAEVGLAAFRRLRDRGMLERPVPDLEQLVEALSAPLLVRGRPVRYRFARQRGRYLKSALDAVSTDAPPDGSHRAFRDWFMRLPGIGPKTASWITRNWLASDEVAIVDIHIYRAGVIAGFFVPTQSPATHYFALEQAYLAFCRHLDVPASRLDALIWHQMKLTGKLALSAFQRCVDNYSPPAKLRRVA